MLRSTWQALRRSLVLLSSENRDSLRETNRRLAAARRAGRVVMLVNLEHPDLLPYLAPLVSALSDRVPTAAFFGTTRHERPESPVPFEGYFDARLTPWIDGSGLYLTPSIHGQAPNGARAVLVPHNQPVRFSDYPRASFAALDAILTMGPLHRAQSERTRTKYALGDRPRLLETGYPKSDALHSGRYDRDRVLTALRLDPSRRTLLYAPAWEEHLSLRAFGTSLFDALLALANRYNVIVKLHPASTRAPSHPQYQYFTGGRDWNALLARYTQHDAFRHVVTADIDPLLAASDLMLTDMSSVALEFLALERPVIYLDCPRFFSETLPRMYRDFGHQDMRTVLADPLINAGRHVGVGISAPEELADAVDRVCATPDLLREERRAFAAQLLFNRGHAAAAAADAVVAMISNGASS